MYSTLRWRNCCTKLSTGSWSAPVESEEGDCSGS